MTTLFLLFICMDSGPKSVYERKSLCPFSTSLIFCLASLNKINLLDSLQKCCGQRQNVLSCITGLVVFSPAADHQLAERSFCLSLDDCGAKNKFLILFWTFQFSVIQKTKTKTNLLTTTTKQTNKKQNKCWCRKGMEINYYFSNQHINLCILTRTSPIAY